MALLTWDNLGERFFETGIDRGVLYTPSGGGVAWNGLTSITESPSGGEATPYYLDGIKYLELSGLEEFGGTIEAFTYPDEFAQCDGTVNVGGLSIYQQRRKTFGLSYRTRVGNDVEGQGYGYKIHIVYNALAQPTSKAYSSIGDSTEPLSFSWDFTTTSISVDSQSNVKPMSHITIDSRKSTPLQMRLIEERLYGTTETPAALISLDQIFSWFENPPLALSIDAKPTTGLSPLTDTGTVEGDLIGSYVEGTYISPIESRLTETSRPGLYTLE